MSDVELRLKLATQEADRELNRFKDRLRRIGDSVDTGGANDGLGGIIANFKRGVEEGERFSQSMLILQGQLEQLAAAFNQVSAASIKSFQDFENASAAVSTISDDSDALISSVRQLVQEQGFLVSETEAVQAAYQILSSGFTETEDVIQILDASIKGAVGGFSDTTTVADALTTTLKAYNLTGAEAAKITDSFIVTQERGKITVDQLASSFGKVAGIAAKAGVDINELQAAIQVYSITAGNANVATTGVNQAIVNILRPTEQAKELAKDLGVEFNAAGLRANGLTGILEQVENSSENLSEDLAILFSDVDGFKAAASLTGQGLEDLREGFEATAAASGNTDENIKKLATSSREVEQLFNELNSALISLGEGVSEALEPAIRIASDLLEQFNKLPEGVQKNVGVAIALAGGFLTLSAAIAGVLAVVPFLVSGATAFAAVAVPLAPTIVALALAFRQVDKVLKILSFEDAKVALDELQKQAIVAGDANIKLANDLASVNRRLQAAQEQGIQITEQEASNARKRIEIGKDAIAQIEREIEINNDLAAANPELAQSFNNLSASRQKEIDAIQGQITILEALLKPIEDVTDAQGELAKSAEEIAKAQQEAFQGFRAELDRQTQLFELNLAKQVNAARAAAIERGATEQEIQAEITAIRDGARADELAKVEEQIAKITQLELAGTVKQADAQKQLIALERQKEQIIGKSQQAIIDGREKELQLAEEAAEKDIEAAEKRADVFDQQTELLQQQASLQQASLALTQSEFDLVAAIARDRVSGLEEALQIKGQLEKLDKTAIGDRREIQLLEERLNELGINSGQTRLQIERQLFAASEERRRLEAQAFDAKQKSEQAALELQNRQNIRAAEREVIEARIFALKSQGDEAALALANEAIALAQQGVQQAREQAQIESEILANKQEQERINFERNQSADELADKLRLAKVEGDEAEKSAGNLRDRLGEGADRADRLASSVGNVTRNLDLATASAAQLEDALSTVEAATGRLGQTVGEYNDLIAEQARLTEALNGSQLAGEIGRTGGRGIGNALVEGVNVESLFESEGQRRAREDRIRQGLLDARDSQGRLSPFAQEAEALERTLDEFLKDARDAQNSLFGIDASSEFGRVLADFAAQDRENALRNAELVVDQLAAGFLPSDRLRNVELDLAKSIERLNSNLETRASRSNAELVELLRNVPGIQIDTLAVQSPRDEPVAASIANELNQLAAQGAFRG